MAASSIITPPCGLITNLPTQQQQPSLYRRLIPITSTFHQISLSCCYSGGGSGGRRGGGRDGGGWGEDGYEEDDDEVRFRFFGKLYRFDKPASTAVSTRTSVSTSSPNSVLDTIVAEMGLGLLACCVIEKMTGCFSSLILSESGKEA